MTAPAPLLEREPVAIGIAGLTAVIDAGIILAAAFDWALTAPQAGALVAFVTACSAFAAPLIRAHVWSPASVAALTAGN
jgi:Na+-transporting NADH:ubiquinone oxidoreductase subunit NqrD